MKWILVKVRMNQLRRQMNALGLFYGFIVFTFLSVLIFYIYVSYSQKEKSLFAFSLTLLALLSIQISRKDKQFVYTQLENPGENIFYEYLLFTLPFTLPCLFTMHWFYFPVLILSIYFIAKLRMNIKQTTRVPHLSKIISPHNFEWLSGLRKNFIGISVFLILSLMISWIRIAPLIFLWLIMTAIISFYQECESLQILFASSGSTKRLLKNKMISHSKLVLIIFIPILIVNSIFNPEMILINVAFLFIQITILIFAILLKYTTYSPNESLKGNTILLSSVSIGALIPFLLPIPIIMCFRNYGKAVRNLKSYFSD
jgi:hypothetical protein